MQEFGKSWIKMHIQYQCYTYILGENKNKGNSFRIATRRIRSLRIILIGVYLASMKKIYIALLAFIMQIKPIGRDIDRWQDIFLDEKMCFIEMSELHQYCLMPV